MCCFNFIKCLSWCWISERMSEWANSCVWMWMWFNWNQLTIMSWSLKADYVCLFFFSFFFLLLLLLLLKLMCIWIKYFLALCVCVYVCVKQNFLLNRYHMNNSFGWNILIPKENNFTLLYKHFNFNFDIRNVSAFFLIENNTQRKY